MLKIKVPHLEKERARIKARIISASLSVVFIGAFITLFVLQANTPPDTSVITGEGVLTVSYVMTYLQNELYKEPAPADKEARLLAYVDKLKLKLDYSLAGFEGMPADYNVSIAAHVIASASESSKYIDPDFIVWQKDYELLKPTKISSDGTVSSFAQVADLDIHQYFEFANSIYEQTQVNTINELKLIFRVNATVHGPYEDVADNSVVELVIPMMDNLLVITGSPKAEAPLRMATAAPQPPPPYLPWMVACGALSVLALAATILLRKGKQQDQETIFAKTVAKMFKQYGERLVRLEKPLHYQPLATIPIDGIVEMVKIADEVSQPIFYYRADTQDEKKIEFYAFDSGRIYYYVIFGNTGEEGNARLL